MIFTAITRYLSRCMARKVTLSVRKVTLWAHKVTPARAKVTHLALQGDTSPSKTAQGDTISLWTVQTV
ncbi:hypothetical protein A8V01_11435 [Novosphingobium guangzhouense]|uniref:Uncharacterized protein n=1 Tax=Novosphingobium guangzhouense TaxID=1850347 RepID=A0A2K2FSB4_9SPHN|nr:hypothetical protein A8V01_11435 [Novosphingobium guangzhouense]